MTQIPQGDPYCPTFPISSLFVASLFLLPAPMISSLHIARNKYIYLYYINAGW